MSHEITRTDANLYAVGTSVPWHGLGVAVDPTVPITQLAHTHGLDWPVHAEQMYMVNRASDCPQFVEVPDQVALVRGDNGFVLGTATVGYKIYANMDGFTSLEEKLSKGGLSVDTLGSLKGGKIVWGLLSFDATLLSETDLGGGDKLRRYLLFSWGHDGKTGLKFGIVTIRVLCNNTMQMAWNSATSKLFSMSHRGNVHANVDMLIDAINTDTVQFEATESQYKKMMATKLSKDAIRDYVKVVMDLEEKGNNRRATNLIDHITNLAISGVGNSGETAWDALNGVTEFLSHEAGRNADNRFASLWFGQNANMLKRAHSEALKLAA